MIVEKHIIQDTIFIHERNETPSDDVILIMPGVSGEVGSSKYDYIAEMCLTNTIDVVRVQCWTDHNDLAKKSLSMVLKHIDIAVEYVRGKGYKQIFAFGKSFGGSLLLLRNHPIITRLVLLAPVIGISEIVMNIKDKDKILLSEIDSMTDVVINKSYASSLIASVCIIHGTNDEIISIANTKKLVTYMSNVKLVEIDGMGHSPQTSREKTEIIEAMIKFLRK
jgi:pimeloyl-ACP methyl ester carboxylesterase